MQFTQLIQDGPYWAVTIPVTLAVALFVGIRYLRPLAAWIAMAGPLCVLVTGITSAWAIMAGAGTPAVEPYVNRVFAHGGATWLGKAIPLTYAVDGLSSLMLIVVGVVSLMVMLFSVGYMAEERGFVRYYIYLLLFTAAMTGLVIAGDLVTLFIAWEVMGAMSYLLIGFWYQKPSASRAALKAFLVTRVGDAGLMAGLALLWTATGTLVLTDVVAKLPTLTAVTGTTAALLLFAGAAGKSAQFPLSMWLPDAMEGPTPVSALIHAATMVAAGVYLVARIWPLFALAPVARMTILVIALITASGAALAAIAQSDIKKVLAYSTISQLGFMFVALGLGAWEVAIFHLTTHAAFKALLFLGSGSVIHGARTQELDRMGGLAKAMPVTFVTWLIGIGALAGLPPLSGFFSKDEILAAAWHGAPVVFAILLLTAAVTAVYSARVTVLAFGGSFRGDAHPHESGVSMLVPLVVLAVPAALLGFFAPTLAALLGQEAEGLAPAIAATSAAVAIGGLAAGWWLWRRGPEADTAIAARLGAVWTLLRGAFGLDRLADAATTGAVRASELVYRGVDRAVIDRAVDGTASGARGLGGVLGRLQNGDGTWYTLLLAATVVVFVAIGLFAGRAGQ
jgi:NADH-quinone oxidoreductase subunit L